MIYLSNEPYPQEISVPRSFGVIVPHRNEYLSTADIAADLETDSDQKVLAASQGVELKRMVDRKANASDVYTKQEVDAELALKADADDVYTKQEVDTALAGKQDELVAGENITIEGNVISATGGGGGGDSYTRAETDALLAEKADADDVYTKSEVDTALAEKADKSDTYTKQQVDTALAGKANANAVYTKTEVDEALAGKADTADIPTKTSDLQNDSGFVTGQEVSQTYETKSDATAKETALQTAINTKQDTINDLATIRSGAAAGATAVQPSQMQTALAGKQDVLTFDTTPTQGSTNPVTSGGIYNVIGDIETLLAAI